MIQITHLHRNTRKSITEAGRSPQTRQAIQPYQPNLDYSSRSWYPHVDGDEEMLLSRSYAFRTVKSQEITRIAKEGIVFRLEGVREGDMCVI